MNDIVKPRIPAAQYEAYTRIAAMPVGTKLVFEGKPAFHTPGSNKK